jgi:murein L,D-transpeptidase YcbB/YkuD
MNKIFLLIIGLITFFVACTQKKKIEKKEKKISSRDYSITKENSYNDLFLDSTAVVNYISKNAIPDSIARRIISFYNTRNYQFAWFASDGLSEQAMGFSSLLNFTGDTSARQKKLHKTMDNLMGIENLSVSEKDPSFINNELLLTESLIDYSLTNFQKGYVKRKELERFIPFKKQDPIKLADSLVNKKHKDDKYFTDINQPYKLLSDQLRKYLSIAKNGGWPAIGNITEKKLRADSNLPQVIAMKKMLFITGDLPQQDTTALVNENLRNGIKNFQTRIGFTADGKIAEPVLKQMNVPVLERIKHLLINMNRMRWLPQQPEGKLIEVNIPAFTLTVYDGNKKAFSMPVVVGKEAHGTTLFSDLLNTIVFSPYWNVPPSIVKNEILPDMEKYEKYLASNDMEITGEENGLPVVRQKPGPKNSLGKVKFLFPNTFNIYFHDTPAKSLFEKDVRAYSHGCIRLSEPEKMAGYLLQNNPKWTSSKISEAMNSGEEQYVKLKEPIPVFITYYTAWVDDAGRLNFRDDIYGHDEEVASKMFIR